MNYIRFDYPTKASPTTSLVFYHAVQLEPHVLKDEYPNPLITTLDGTDYSYRKAVYRTILPLKIDLMLSIERSDLINWINNIVLGGFRAFDYTNQANTTYNVKIMEDMLDIGEGSYPYSTELTLLVT